MTRNRTRGLRRGQDVQSSSRGSDRAATSASSANSSNFDEENFWSSLEKNYFSPPPVQLIRSIKNARQMYKIIDASVSGGRGKDTRAKPYSIEFKVNKCRRYKDSFEWAVKCARDRYGEGWPAARRTQSGFDPEVSPKYHGRGTLPLVMRPGPNFLTLTLMDSPFSLQTEVLSTPACRSDGNELYGCNDEAWALHPRFSLIAKRCSFSFYPPYTYQQFPERVPFCHRCNGLQRSCGEAPTMDFNIRPTFPEACFIPSKLPINQLRRSMSNMDNYMSEIIPKDIFKPFERRRKIHENEPKFSSGFAARIEDDYCATFEFYTDLVGKLGRKLDDLLHACEAEKHPNYAAWKETELRMMSQYMNEYRETNTDTLYAYTSAIQIGNIQHLRVTCKDSAMLPSNWTEKALCSVCSTADDWDDNPIMFCDCCYLPMHVKCVAAEVQELGDESWVCQLCSFLISQIPHIETPRAFDAIRRLGTEDVEKRGECLVNNLRLAKFDSTVPFLPISDTVYDKFVKAEASATVDNIYNGWPFVRDPRIYAKMSTPHHTDAAPLVPFCMLCGFSTLCLAGGPALPTNRPPLWAHVKCALTIEIAPKRSGEEAQQAPRKGGAHLYTGRCFDCKRWGSCLVQCSNAECTKFFHIPCVTALRECLYEWDTVLNKPEILCQVHAKGVSPTSLLRKVQQRLEGDCYRNRAGTPGGLDVPFKRDGSWKLGIYAKDFLETDKSRLLQLFRDAYCRFRSPDSDGDTKGAAHAAEAGTEGVLLVCFNQNGLSPQFDLQPDGPAPASPPGGGGLKRERESLEQGPLEQMELDRGPLEPVAVDDELDVSIPLETLPTPCMLMDIFTDLPSFQTVRYASGLTDDKNVSFFRSACEAAVVLSELFNLGRDVKFIVNLFNYISGVSFRRGLDICGPEVARQINSRAADQFCSGCGIVESKRVTVKRCGSCLASICKSCFAFGVGAARSTANCTNSQFESGVVTCARCYRFVCGQSFGSCHLCGRLDGFLFAGSDCLVHLICAQLLIPPKCWGDGLRLGRVKNTRVGSCHYCRLNIGLTSTCASPICGVRFHPYCAFVLKKHSISTPTGSATVSSSPCVAGPKKDRTNSEKLLKAKKPGVAFARILCVVHSEKGDAIHSREFTDADRRAAVCDFFRGIDYTFTHRHTDGKGPTLIRTQSNSSGTVSTRKKGEGKMDAERKRGAKKPDLRKFLTMQEIMQYGHSGRTSDDQYYCPICFSLYYETTPGLPGDDLHWIGCDGCERWFHWICIGYSDNDPPKDSDWFCVTCKNPKEGQRGTDAQHQR